MRKKYQTVRILNTEIDGVMERLANLGVEADVIYAAFLFTASLVREKMVKAGVEPEYFEAADATVAELIADQIKSEGKLMVVDGGKA